MLLKTADWDDALQTHNALATETKFLTYQIVHEFNRPARAIITLADPDGSTSRKYDVDAANDSVYIGPGRAYIEDPTGTPLFEGRILRAVPTMNSKNKPHLVLECEDWLGQLDDERINYDMRESLNADDLRQSEAHTDADSTIFVGPAAGIITAAYLDDGGAFTDYTAASKSETTNDVMLLPAVPAVNDAFYFGFTRATYAMSIYISTTGSWTGNCIWEYWNGAAWTSCGYTPGNKHNFEAGGLQSYTFTCPSWATTAVNGTTLYWIRARVQTYTAIVTPPKSKYIDAEWYLFDDDMAWAADTYNGMNVMLMGSMAGTITVGTGPYQGSATGADGYSDDPHVTWVDDNTTDLSSDNDASYNQDYDFRIKVGNNTPSDFYVHDSITAARVTVCYQVTGDCTCKLQIDDKTNGWIDLEDLNIGFGVSRRLTVQIPTEYLSDIIDADGIASVRFALTWGSGDVSIAVKYLWLEVDVSTTGYSSAVSITDTLTNYLIIGTDLTAAATCIWEGCPYAIAKPIYKHIDTVEGGTLVSNGDVVYAMTAAANVEHTSGISTRHFIERSRLEILQALAKEDKSVFYVPLGTVALTWKSTFSNGAPTALTDANFLVLQGDWNYPSMFNTVTAYGARIGTYQLSASSEDSTSTDTYGINKTKIEKNTGVLSDYDCAALADTLVAQNKDVKLYLQAELPGLSTLRLGDEVSITSTFLGLTAQVYTITHWAYSPSSYRTSIRLQPRASTTGYQTNVTLEGIRTQSETIRQGEGDKYIPDLYTQEWTPV